MENIVCWTGLGLYNGNEARSHIQYKYLFIIQLYFLLRHIIIPEIWTWRHIHNQHWHRVGPKGTKYSVSILWFISTQLTLTLVLNTKFKTALAETMRQDWLGTQALSIPARVPHLLAEHSFQSQIFEPHQKYLGFFSFIFSCSLFAARAITSFPTIIQRHTFHEYKKN